MKGGRNLIAKIRHNLGIDLKYSAQSEWTSIRGYYDLVAQPKIGLESIVPLKVLIIM